MNEDYLVNDITLDEFLADCTMGETDESADMIKYADFWEWALLYEPEGRPH